MRHYEPRIGRLLRYGIIASFTIMAAGLLLAAFQPLPAEAESNPTLKSLLLGLFSGASSVPMASLLMFAGLTLLMLTPFVRVFVSLLAFRTEKDWRFVGIAVVVFCILIGQLIYSLQ